MQQLRFQVQGSEFNIQRPAPKVQALPRIRLMQKDMYTELMRRRRRAQVVARQWVEGRRGS